MATSKTSPLKSANLWTGIATLVAAIFAYFQLSPDLSTAATLSDAAAQAADAIATRNWVLLISVLINAGNILWHLFKK